jgi:putative salt-induced outer membrane protein
MRFFVSVAIAAACTAPAYAQPAAAPPPPFREGKAEFAFVSTSGNSETQSLALGSEVIVRPTDWVLLGRMAFVRNEAVDVVSARSLATLARAARVLTPRLQVFGQHGYLRDLFSGIAHRNGIDGGLSFNLIGTDRHTLFADGSLGYLRESRVIGRSLSTAFGAGGLRYKLKLSPTSDLTDDLLLTADFSEGGTWRVAQAAALTARVLGALSLKLSNQIRFVNEPVVGFEQTDVLTSAALVLSF